MKNNNNKNKTNKKTALKTGRGIVLLPCRERLTSEIGTPALKFGGVGEAGYSMPSTENWCLRMSWQQEVV